ncbi:MAG: DUF6398 domain-containing protein, partial [Armatimonadota bacterium]
MEYEQLIQKLINKMARKRNVPFIFGKIEIWAAAVIHAAGTINFLFDNSQSLHISDNGITIKGSYDKKGLIVKNDSEAIRLALNGKSTKGEERGYGLRTTRNLITESPLNGEFLILSGQSGYYKGKNNELLFDLSCRWEGTIILLRVK